MARVALRCKDALDGQHVSFKANLMCLGVSFVTGAAVQFLLSPRVIIADKHGVLVDSRSELLGAA